jgi:anti-sigma B factor antagonist
MNGDRGGVSPRPETGMASGVEGNGAMTHFSIERNEEAERLRLALYGELDLYSAPRLDDELVRAEGEMWPELVLDLCRLDFMDSSGLRLLLRAHARAEQEGRRVRIVHSGGTVGRVLRITSVDKALDVTEIAPAAS